MAIPNDEELAILKTLLQGICDRRPQKEDAWRAAEIGLSLIKELEGIQERFRHILALARIQELHNCITMAEKYGDKLDAHQKTIGDAKMVSPGGACHNLAMEFKTLLPLDPFEQDGG